MCHYRGSYEADAKAKAEAERQEAIREKELQAKRSEVVDRLRREADEPRPADQPVRVPEDAAAK